MNMQVNEEQSVLWNGIGGRGWVEVQSVLDEMFAPFGELLVAAVAKAGLRVLDVGCGTGGTTLAVARRAERCVGIDISEPMVAVARARAEREGSRATFVRADAQSHAFEPDSFDMVMSRLGVMFFDDPVGAFANLRRAAVSGAELHFVAWRSAAENPFMTTAERTAAPLLPNIPPRRPDAPGQFAFADRSRVERILQESGWQDVDIHAIDVVCGFPEKELTRYLTYMGPVGRILQESDERTRERVLETVRGAFEGFVKGNDVRFVAACWKVSAR